MRALCSAQATYKIDNDPSHSYQLHTKAFDTWLPPIRLAGEGGFQLAFDRYHTWINIVLSFDGAQELYLEHLGASTV